MKVKLDENALPVLHEHKEDAGYDLRTPVDIWVPGNQSVTIDTGVHMQIPYGYAGFLKSKSGLNVKNGLTGEGVIDSGYTGSIVAKIYNNTSNGYQFHRGDKIIQIVLLPVYLPELEYVETLGETERGTDGFGSTGK